MSFKPRFWPTLITVPAVLCMLALGTWQVDRLFTKRALIERIETGFHQPAMAAPDTIEGNEYRRVSVTGTFRHDLEMLLVGRPEKGTVGYHVVTPLVASDGTVYLINRGWIPQDRKEQERRPESITQGIVSVDTILRRDHMKGYFTPDNEPQNAIWFYFDTKEMAAHAGLGPVAPYELVALAGPDDPRLPIGAHPEGIISIRNEHLNYAITWYSLAVALIIVYVAWHRRQDRDEKDGQNGDASSRQS